MLRACLPGILAATFALGGGCQESNPPLARVAIPDRPDRSYERDEIKPLPDQGPRGDAGADSDLPPPPFDDVPLVSQRTPEHRRFVESYNRVGRPRIAVFVNRTLDGQIIPVTSEPPLFHDGRTDAPPDDYRNGNGRRRDREPQYDAPADIDYEAIETILTDWLSADGQVEIISPVMARRRLSDAQVKELQGGDPGALGDVARELNNDVLVQVQARPTRQSRGGPSMRIVSEAINVRGGQSIARAVVDVPPPLDEPQIMNYTRYLSRKLMDGMVASWDNLQPAGDRDRAEPRDTRPPDTDRDAVEPSDRRGDRPREPREADEPASPPRDATPPRSTSPSGSADARDGSAAE